MIWLWTCFSFLFLDKIPHYDPRCTFPVHPFPIEIILLAHYFPFAITKLQQPVMFAIIYVVL